MKAKITIPQQVQIINKALASYIEDVDEECFNVGLCWHFHNAIHDITKIDCNYSSIELFIPLFTIENAITHAKASNKIMWWEKTNSYDRIYFCKWMLKTMKKEMINNFITNILYKKYNFKNVEVYYSEEFNKYIIIPHSSHQIKSNVIKSLIRFHNKYKKAFGEDCLVIMKESEYITDEYNKIK